MQLSSTHSTNAFSGGFKYSPTMSNNFGSNSGSGLKLKVRMRCGCNSDAFRITCTVLGGRPTFRANVRTVQRPCDSGGWQAKYVGTYREFPYITKNYLDDVLSGTLVLRMKSR